MQIEIVRKARDAEKDQLSLHPRPLRNQYRLSLIDLPLTLSWENSEMSMGVVNRTNAKVNTTKSPLSIPNSVSLGSAFGLAIRFGQMQNCQIFTQAI